MVLVGEKTTYQSIWVDPLEKVGIMLFQNEISIFRPLQEKMFCQRLDKKKKQYQSVCAAD